MAWGSDKGTTSDDKRGSDNTKSDDRREIDDMKIVKVYDDRVEKNKMNGKVDNIERVHMLEERKLWNKGGALHMPNGRTGVGKELSL